MTHDELVTLMVGRDVSQVFPRAAEHARPAAARSRGDLSVRGLPGPITLEARAGEIVGLVGLNGAGRTRLAKGLFGAIPARGEIAIDGVTHTAFRRPADAMRAGVAFIPEDRKIEGLALTKSVRSNVSLNVVERVAGRVLSSAGREALRRQGRRRPRHPHPIRRQRRPPDRSRAATSRRSCSPSGSPSTPRC